MLSSKNEVLPRFMTTSKISHITKASTNLDYRKTFSTFDKKSNIKITSKN
jgi:hypothetical protein